jgi:hypothetical protein
MAYSPIIERLALMNTRSPAAVVPYVVKGVELEVLRWKILV